MTDDHADPAPAARSGRRPPRGGLPQRLAALRELTMNRILVMCREPEVAFWVFGFPVLVAVGLGIAFSDPTPETFQVAVERGSPAEAYAEALDGEEGLSVQVVDPGEAQSALARGEVVLLVAGEGDGVTFVFDPARAEGRMARLMVDNALQSAAGVRRPLHVREEEVRQRGQRYIDWLIPGLIGFNLMGTGLWAVGFYVAQARQSRQLKRLVATPMRRSDFLLSQILARFSFLVAEVPVLVIVAWLLFGVTVQGSLLALGVIVLVGAACFSGMGLLASARTRTTEGVSGIINVIIMPMVVLSGVFFSTARFPDGLQPFIQALPLTALNDALRAVYNDGLPLHSTVGELAILAAWTVGCFLLALRWFRWQ